MPLARIVIVPGATEAPGAAPAFAERRATSLLPSAARQRHLARELACAPFGEIAFQLNPAIEASRPKASAELRGCAARLSFGVVTDREARRGEVFGSASGDAVGIVSCQRDSPQNGLWRVRLKPPIEPALAPAPHRHDAFSAQGQPISRLGVEFRHREQVLIELHLDRNVLSFDDACPKAPGGDVNIGRIEGRWIVPQNRCQLRKPSLPGCLYALGRESIRARLAGFQARQIETVARKRNLQLS